MANLRANNLTGSDGRNAIDGSVFFNSDANQNSYLKVTTTSDLALGTGDFTIETWVYFTSTGTYQSIIDFRVSNGLFPFLVRDTDGDLYWHINGSTLIDNIPARENHFWHHVAVVRSSGTTKIYLNGVEKGSASDSTNYVATNDPFIGASVSSSNDLFGYLSNLRITKSALYTANFTPPTEKLTVVPNTVLLCCQDSDNALQEATGKTITGYGRHPSAAYDGNGEGPELVTSTGVWTLACGGGGCSNFTVTNNGQTLSGTTVTSGYIRATYTGLDSRRRYRIKVTHTAGSNNNFSVQGDNTGYRDATDGTAGTALQVGSQYVFEWSGSTTVVITGSAWNKLYTIDNISIKQIPNSPAPKILPSVGADNGVVFDGVTKIDSLNYMTLPTGTTEQRGGHSGRMVVGGGEVNSPGVTNVIEYFNFAHFSNGVDFGDLTQTRRKVSSCASSTRGIWAGGGSPGATDRIDYVTIANTGDAIDFGNLFTGVSDDSSQCFGASNDIRGIFAGGYNNVNTIQYITIASAGNALNFGDLQTGRFDHAALASPTRLVIGGGKKTGASPDTQSSIEYVTIATTGDAIDFGDLTGALRGPSGLSSNTRGLMGGGSPNTNLIQYITIASTGNAQDFGDLLQARQETLAGGTSNNTRGVWAGGQNPGYSSMLDAVWIPSMGNAVDWGNLTTGTSGAGSVSDSHGGLS